MLRMTLHGAEEQTKGQSRPSACSAATVEGPALGLKQTVLPAEDQGRSEHYICKILGEFSESREGEVP